MNVFSTPTTAAVHAAGVQALADKLNGVGLSYQGMDRIPEPFCFTSNTQRRIKPLESMPRDLLVRTTGKVVQVKVLYCPGKLGSSIYRSVGYLLAAPEDTPYLQVFSGLSLDDYRRSLDWFVQMQSPLDPDCIQGIRHIDEVVAAVRSCVMRAAK